MQGAEWELGKILDHVKAELHAREQCAQLKQSSASNATISKPPFRQLHTTSALMNNTSKISCSFCKGSHPSAKCHIVTDVNQRKGILRKQGHCFICLKRGHISRECPSRILCFVCKQRHHSSICESTAELAVRPRNTQMNVNQPHWQS